jgi:hypothetical protein
MKFLVKFFGYLFGIGAALRAADRGGRVDVPGKPF